VRLEITYKHINDMVRAGPASFEMMAMGCIFSCIGGVLWGFKKWVAVPMAQLQMAMALINPSLLEANLPDSPGFELIADLSPETGLVILSTTEQYAFRAFECGAVDYLLKPITASRLDRALRRIQARRPQLVLSKPMDATPVHHRYPVQAGTGVVLVDLAKTTHFEVENEVVWAHAGTRLRTTWTSLAEVENAFPGAGLLRIHRHLVVRPEAVIGLKPAAGGRAIVRLQGGAEIEASRGGAPRLRERLGL